MPAKIRKTVVNKTRNRFWIDHSMTLANMGPPYCWGFPSAAGAAAGSLLAERAASIF